MGGDHGIYFSIRKPSTTRSNSHDHIPHRRIRMGIYNVEQVRKKTQSMLTRQ
jgi:hypothetical protein